MMLETYAQKIGEVEVENGSLRDYHIHGMIGSTRRIMSKLEEIRLKPRKTLDRKITHDIGTRFGRVYWHFVHLVQNIGFDLSEVEKRSEDFIDVEEADRHFEEGFEDFRRVMQSAAKIANIRSQEIECDCCSLEEKVSLETLADIHVRMRRAIHHFGLFDLRLMLERDLQQRKNDKSLTLYDKPK